MIVPYKNTIASLLLRVHISSLPYRKSFAIVIHMKNLWAWSPLLIGALVAAGADAISNNNRLLFNWVILLFLMMVSGLVYKVLINQDKS